LQRRHGRKPLSRDARVEDVAKGLRDAFERDRRLVGPLMEDYRDTASALVDVLEAYEAKRAPTTCPTPSD
jgi:hypothetical protein